MFLWQTPIWWLNILYRGLKRFYFCAKLIRRGCATWALFFFFFNWKKKLFGPWWITGGTYDSRHTQRQTLMLIYSTGFCARLECLTVKLNIRLVTLPHLYNLFTNHFCLFKWAGSVTVLLSKVFPQKWSYYSITEGRVADDSFFPNKPLLTVWGIQIGKEEMASWQQTLFFQSLLSLLLLTCLCIQHRTRQLQWLFGTT